MRRLAGTFAAIGLGSIAVFAEPVSASDRQEVMAIENGLLPGALLCADAQTFEIAVRQYGPRAQFGSPFWLNRCVRVRAGTVMKLEGVDWRGFPRVAATTSDGYSFRGVTAGYMIVRRVQLGTPLV